MGYGWVDYVVTRGWGEAGLRGGWFGGSEWESDASRCPECVGDEVGVGVEVGNEIGGEVEVGVGVEVGAVEGAAAGAGRWRVWWEHESKSNVRPWGNRAWSFRDSVRQGRRTFP